MRDVLAPDTLEQVLAALGAVLTERGHAFELVVVGGSTLLLHGASVRPTRDLDVLAVVEAGQLRDPRPLPAPLVEAARDVGLLYGLGADWLNPGPAAQLASGLPPGFADRLARCPYGGLVLHLPGRLDLVCLKLYAAADAWPRPSKHLDDLRRLAPTRDELAFAAAWVAAQDPSEPFQRLLADLRAALDADAG